jgi:REP element-mobilizing transposase RayT
MSTYCSLPIHLVFATKHRRPVIAVEWRDELHAYLGGTVMALGSTNYGVGGTNDHVHILLGLRPTQTLAKTVQEIKKSSSVWAQKHCPSFAWQIGYGGFGIRYSDIPSVQSYIQRQEEHHRRWSSQDEMRAMLIEFGIEIDEKYFV